MKKLIIALALIYGCGGSNPDPKPFANLFSHYYELTKEPLNTYVQVPKDNLFIQYINDYASVNVVTVSIYDAETLSLVSPSQNNPVQNINGLNRIFINLNNYPVTTGRYYFLTVSNSKTNYYLNFKIIN